MSNEIIRAKAKIHALISDYENLVVSVGGTFIVLYLVASLVLAIALSPFVWSSITGAIGTWFGIVFLLKEYEAETGEKTGWLHDDY